MVLADITVSLGGIVAAITGFVMVVGAIVETRVRVYVLDKKTEILASFQESCNRDRTKQYDEIKDLLAKLRTAMVATKVRVQVLAEQNGVHIPDAEVDDNGD